MFELFLKYEFKGIWYDIVPFDYDVDKLQEFRRSLKRGEGKKMTIVQDFALVRNWIMLLLD